MGKQEIVKNIFAVDHSSDYTNNHLIVDKYATKESVDEVKDRVCNLVSSVKAIERQRKVDKRRCWRNATKSKRR